MEITTCSLSKASNADPKKEWKCEISLSTRTMKDWQATKARCQQNSDVFPQKSVTLVDFLTGFASRPPPSSGGGATYQKCQHVRTESLCWYHPRDLNRPKKRSKKNAKF